jgi:hypothetical protein
MIAKLALVFAAFGLQFLLLHSHKSGHSHWVWIASISAIVLAIGSRAGASNATAKWITIQALILAVLSLLLPPVIYVLREWMQVPSYVANALARDAWFYLVSITITSGGWLFGILLLWLRWNAISQRRVSGPGVA